MRASTPGIAKVLQMPQPSPVADITSQSGLFPLELVVESYFFLNTSLQATTIYRSECARIEIYSPSSSSPNSSLSRGETEGYTVSQRLVQGQGPSLLAPKTCFSLVHQCISDPLTDPSVSNMGLSLSGFEYFVLEIKLQNFRAREQLGDHLVLLVPSWRN